MTDILNACPVCGNQSGHCRHTTEGQVTTQRPSQRAVAALLGTLPRLSAEDVSDPYVARAGTVGQDPALVPARQQPDTAPVRLPVSAAAGGTVGKRNNQLYDPKCRELAEYFASDRELSDERLDELAQCIQDTVEMTLGLWESEGQS
jgi:hypothetical protein